MKRRPITALPIVLGLACALAASAAVAAPGGAERLLRRAQQQVAEGEFDGARQTLIQARLSEPAPALLGQIEFHLGLVWHTMDEHQQARRALQRALAHSPDLEPDPERFKPSFVALFLSVRQGLKGKLLVTSNAVDARVSIDGRAAGRVPYRGAVVVGAHTVVVRAGAGRSRTERVTVALGRQTRLHLPLPPVSARRDPAPVTRPRSGRLLWTWVAAAGTVVATGVAIGFGVAASSSHDDGEALRAERPFDAERYAGMVDDLDRHRLSANISWGIAGALAVTTAALFYWEWWRDRRSERGSEQGTRAAVVPGARLRGLDLTLSF